MQEITIEQLPEYSIGRFTAMACPCEILSETLDKKQIQHLTELAFNEARRIEKKFSRYRDDNIIFQINNARGKAVEVDDETALMLDFADQCYDLSEGKFDITSGVLRKVWKFDGSDNIPEPHDIEEIMPYIGWNKVNWQKPAISLPVDMQIDLGGIGKEYAVDSTVNILKRHTDKSFLVNFGGDIACPFPRKNKTPWTIGVDDPENTGKNALGKIALYAGGLATSGDARRYLVKDGVRYSHILDPLTGYPVPDAPRSVSVISATCLEAGMLSTFAMLQGNNAVEFLKAQEVKYWCIP